MVSCIISISYFVLRKLPCEAFTCTFVHMERDMILWRSAKILSLCGLPTSYSDWSGAWVLCVSHPALPALSTSRQQALTCLCTCVTVPSSSLVLDVQGGSTRTFITSEYIDDSEILVCHQIKQIKPDDRHWKSHSGAKSFFFFFFFLGWKFCPWRHFSCPSRKHLGVNDRMNLYSWGCYRPSSQQTFWLVKAKRHQEKR